MERNGPTPVNGYSMGQSWPLEGCAIDPRSKSIELRMNGTALHTGSSHSDSCGRETPAYRQSDGSYLVEIFLSHADLRVITSKASLRQSGGCGMGSLSRGAQKVFVVKGPAPVFFSDGTPAGHHQGNPTRLRDAEVIGERVCAKKPWLNDVLCVDRAGLEEVIDY